MPSIFGFIVLFFSGTLAQILTGEIYNFQCKTWTGGSVIIRRNVVLGTNAYCSSTGITINGAPNVIIEENNFFSSKFGITITGATNVVINRNTFSWFTRSNMDFISINTVESANITNNIFYAVPYQPGNVGGDINSFVRVANTKQTNVNSNWFWYGSGRTSIWIDSTTVTGNVVNNYFYGSLIGLTMGATQGQVGGNTFVSEDGRYGSGAILFTNGCNYGSLTTNHFKWTANGTANVIANGGSACIPDSTIDTSLYPLWKLPNGVGALFQPQEVTTPYPNPACSSDLVVSMIAAGTAISNNFPQVAIYANISGTIRQFTYDGAPSSPFAYPDYSSARYNFRLANPPSGPLSIFLNWTGDAYWPNYNAGPSPKDLTPDVTLGISEIRIQGGRINLVYYNNPGCTVPTHDYDTADGTYMVIDSPGSCLIWNQQIPDVSVTASPQDCITSTDALLSSEDASSSAMYIGIGAGLGFLVLLGLGILILIFILKNRRRQNQPSIELHMSNYSELSIPSAARLPASSPGSMIQHEDATHIKFKDLKLTEKIGEGGFGIVWKGKWKGTDVAVKQLKQFDTLGTKHIDEFIQEATLMRTMKSHPNVVQYFGISTDKFMCIITEYLEGGSLKQYVKSNSINIQQTKQIMKDIAQGMAHLESQKIVHKDLAARNVLMNQGGQAKVSDFGLSRVSQSGENNTVFTSAEVGPIKWMPPESLKHRKFTSKSDVYAFGVTCIEILTKKDPYPDIDLLQFSMRVLGEGLNLRNSVPSTVPKTLADLIVACLAETPEERPTFREIVTRL